jgi:hypothetical protein
MRIRDTNESVWTAGETSEELGDILKCGDRAALKLLVSERLNWRDCLDLLPAMVELALEDEPRKRGRPVKNQRQLDFDAIACLAKSWIDKKTYTATWKAYVGLGGQAVKPKNLTGEMALAYLTTAEGKTSYVKRAAMARFKIPVSKVRF